MAEEVGQLLIAAEALVMLAELQLNRYDNALEMAKKYQKRQPPFKTRDQFQDLKDDYLHLYDDVYNVIEMLKKNHTEAGVVGFIERHLSKVLDVIGDRIKETEELANVWLKIALNPLENLDI